MRSPASVMLRPFHKANINSWTFMVASLWIIAWATSSSIATAQSLYQQIQSKSPEIIEYLNDRKIKTVGVLKFRVQKPGEKTTDSAGPLNSMLADRLEVALVLANPFAANRQLNIIRDASSQISDTPSATHLTKEGRKRFFDPKYSLAWGDAKLQADAFITGVVQVNEDRKSAKIGILCFERDGLSLDRIGEPFDAQLDVMSVTEMGESYLLRGAFDDGQLKSNAPTDASDLPSAGNVDTDEQTQVVRTKELEGKAIEEASRVRTQLTSFPLKDSSAPVKLEIFYNGKPVEIEVRNGQAFIQEPVEGQTVEMAISRATFVQGTLGVVLKVNGENTLYRQTQRDLDCSRWLLTPEHTRTVIKGYQLSDSNVAEKFQVLSESESAKRAIDYGRNVGQIQITVFREKLAADPTTESTDSNEDEDLVALLRGAFPENTPRDLDVLKTQIRHDSLAVNQTRNGLIVAGDETESSVELTTFIPDPVPVMSATITYYTP